MISRFLQRYCEGEVGSTEKAYLVPYLPVTPTSVHYSQLELLKSPLNCTSTYSSFASSWLCDWKENGCSFK
jgi:hypothetical protein